MAMFFFFPKALQKNLMKEQRTHGLGKAIYAKLFQISSFTVCSLESSAPLIYKF